MEPRAEARVAWRAGAPGGAAAAARGSAPLEGLEPGRPRPPPHPSGPIHGVAPLSPAALKPYLQSRANLSNQLSQHVEEMDRLSSQRPSSRMFRVQGLGLRPRRLWRRTCRSTRLMLREAALAPAYRYWPRATLEDTPIRLGRTGARASSTTRPARARERERERMPCSSEVHLEAQLPQHAGRRLHQRLGSARPTIQRPRFTHSRARSTRRW